MIKHETRGELHKVSPMKSFVAIGYHAMMCYEIAIRVSLHSLELPSASALWKQAIA